MRIDDWIGRMATRDYAADEANRAVSGRSVAVRGTGSIGMRHLHVLRDRLGCVAIAVPVRSERATATLRRLGSVLRRQCRKLRRMGRRSR